MIHVGFVEIILKPSYQKKKKKETQTQSAVEINSLNVQKQLMISALPVGKKRALLMVLLEWCLMMDLYGNYISL